MRIDNPDRGQAESGRNAQPAANFESMPLHVIPSGLQPQPRLQSAVSFGIHSDCALPRGHLTSGTCPLHVQNRLLLRNHTVRSRRCVGSSQALSQVGMLSCYQADLFRGQKQGRPSSHFSLCSFRSLTQKQCNKQHSCNMSMAPIIASQRCTQLLC